MDEESAKPSTRPDAIPTLEDAVERADLDAWVESQVRDGVAARLEQALNREFDRLVGEPVSEALAQGLEAYRAQLRSILLRELLDPSADDAPIEPDR